MAISTSSTKVERTLDTDADFVALNCGDKTQPKRNNKDGKRKKNKHKAESSAPSDIKPLPSSEALAQSTPKPKKRKHKNLTTETTEVDQGPVFFVDVTPKIKEKVEQQSSTTEQGLKKRKRKKEKASADANSSATVVQPASKPDIEMSSKDDEVSKPSLNESELVKEPIVEVKSLEEGGKKKKRKKEKPAVVANSSENHEKPLTDSNITSSATEAAATPSSVPQQTENKQASHKDPPPVDSNEKVNPDQVDAENDTLVRPSKKRKGDKAGKKSRQPPTDGAAAATSDSREVSSKKSCDPPSHKSLPTPAELENFISINKITYEPSNIMTEFPPILEFDHVKVTSPLEKAFLKFQKPSPIQSAVWPVLIAKRDVVGIAETGSGKTLAFGIPAFEHMISSPSLKKGPAVISVLVIAPTRELAMQTEATLCELGKMMSPPIKTLCVYGGVDKNAQRKALGEGVRAVAGTPGRLLDLANEGHLKLNNVSWLVLDEADRMLDKGFENDIRAIINLCLPSKSPSGGQTRLTAMFSATWPMSVRRLASDFMHEPVRILVGDDQLSASCSVEQTVEVLDDTRGKEGKLIEKIRELGNSKTFNLAKDKIIVFALYKKEAQRLHQFLLRKGFQACCIEGDMSQDKRTKSLQDFKTGLATILVATDVAARGLDIPKVEVVINVTFPLTIEDYIHRIGRTGRAGRTGKSITFFTEDDKVHAGELMRVLKDANQTVPQGLTQWGGQIKKKTHAAYGDHWKDIDPTVKATKIKFD